MFLQSIVMAAFFSAVAGFNPDFALLRSDAKQYFLGWLIRWVIAFVLSTLVFYFGMPTFVGPFWGMTGMLVTFWVANGGITWAISYNRSGEFPAGNWIVVAFLGLASILGIGSTGCVQSSKMRSMIGEVESREWNEDFKPIDLRHMIQVSLEQAEWRGRQILARVALSSARNSIRRTTRCNG